MVLIGEIVDMARFSSFRQLSSYTGLIPSSYSTGDKERTGDMTDRRNKRLRTALIESSWSAIKSDPELKLKYEQYRQRMKSQEAIVRIARILLRRIRLVWLSGKKYKKIEFDC
jgi:transposase